MVALRTEILPPVRKDDLRAKREHAMRVLAVLSDASLSPEKSAALCTVLRPRAADFNAVFRPCAALRARTAYAGLWSVRPSLRHPPGRDQLYLSVARAEDLFFGTAAAAVFPEEYRGCGELIRRGTVWATWRFDSESGAQGAQLDGLVAVDNRWVWFPRPYLFLDPARDAGQALRHWVD